MPSPPAHTAAPSKPKDVECARSKTHQVAVGENAFRIAKRYGVTVDALARRNGIDDPSKIRLGQVLVIPEDASTGGASRQGTSSRCKGAQSPGGARSSASTPGQKTPTAATRVSSPSPAEVRLDCAAFASKPPPSLMSARTRDGSSSAASPDELRWPVDGVVVSKFGHVEAQPHDGIDIAAPLGTPIRAAATGTVRFAGFKEGYGEIVILEHGGERVTIYAHNAKNCVESGRKVETGEVVALVGQSGGANAPVVHFEVRDGLKPLDPRRFLR